MMIAFFIKKYKRKRKKRGTSYFSIGAIGIVLIAALGLLGAGYAAWTQKFELFGTISTGSLNVSIKDVVLESSDSHESLSFNAHKEGGIVEEVDMTVVTASNPFHTTLIFSVENNGTLPVACTGIDTSREGNLHMEVLDAPPVIDVGETGTVRVSMSKGYCDDFGFHAFLRFEQEVLSASRTLINASYALWNHDAEVAFTLTITEPDQGGEDFQCGSYDTIQEGIDLLKDVKFAYIYELMGQFQNELEARVSELNDLPFGGITESELQAECDGYRDRVENFGTMIHKYGRCINALAQFYNSSSQEEKNQVPNFWSIHTMLWSLHGELWDKRGDLYDGVNEVWETGQEKIDYIQGGNGNGKGQGKDQSLVMDGNLSTSEAVYGY